MNYSASPDGKDESDRMYQIPILPSSITNEDKDKYKGGNQETKVIVEEIGEEELKRASVDDGDSVDVVVHGADEIAGLIVE